MTRALGCDISFWNGAVNFNTMKSAGASWVCCKASQLAPDSMFPTYWHDAKPLLPRHAYHYLDWRESELTQADRFVDTMKGDFGEMPPVCDFEQDPNIVSSSYKLAMYPNEDEDDDPHPYSLIRGSHPGKFSNFDKLGLSQNNLKLGNLGISASEVQGRLWNFLQRVEQRTGRVPMIYTGYYYWLAYGTPDPAWSKYLFWLAWYASESIIKVPPPWSKWTLWQYTGNGNGPMYGSTGLSMDLNYYNGTVDELNAWIASMNGTNPEPTICPCCGQQIPCDGSEPPPPPPENIYVPITGKNPNVHYPNWDSPSIGYLTYNPPMQVIVDGESNSYLHFIATQKFPNGGWVYKPYMTKL